MSLKHDQCQAWEEEIARLKEANKVLRDALDNIRNKKKNFFEEENPIVVAKEALYVADEIMGRRSE